MATAWRARPERPSPFQGIVGLVLVFALCMVVAAPSAKGAQLAMVQRDLVTSVFSDSSAAPSAAGAAKPKSKAKDPWKDIPRVNLLLLGSDAGADRTGVRTDSMMVVSINTKTGDAMLVGLPRSLQNAPFPESNPLHAYWPNGFNCGSECLLNAVWNQAAVQHTDLFKGNNNPGLTSTRDVISEITGLRIDNYVTIDMAGFQGLVNAMGGVDVNVHQRLPIGGGDSQRDQPRAARRSPAGSSPASSTSTATRRCGSPARGTARTTTTACAASAAWSATWSTRSTRCACSASTPTWPTCSRTT